MLKKRPIYLLICLIALTAASCGIYKFNDTGGMDFTKVKTIKVGFIENRASYVNPQL